MRPFLILPLLFSASLQNGPHLDVNECGEICEKITGPCACEAGRIRCTDEELETANLCVSHEYDNVTFTKVELDENVISYLQRDSIMPELRGVIRELDVTENRINAIDDEAFIGFDNLEYLSLESNNITRITTWTFKHLAKLKMLDIRSNLIRDLTGNPFGSLISLQKLYLDNNPITSVDSSAFSPLKELLVLSIDDARLEAVDPEWFKPLTKLKSLSLANNRIVSIPKLTLPSLTLLQLSSNHFTTIPTDAFMGVESVEELRIDAIDTLERVEDCAFCHLVSLSTLVVAHCSKLTDFSSAAFGSTLPRDHLDISNNGITTLASNTLNWKAIRNVQLQMNPWHCNCSIEWIIEMAPSLQEPPKCAVPPALKDHDIRLLHPEDLHCPHNTHRAIAIFLVIFFCLLLSVIIWFAWQRRGLCKDRCTTLFDGITLPGYSYKNLSAENDQNNLVINDYLEDERREVV